jgi:hypothetical protein
MLRLVGSRLAERQDRPLPSLFWAAGFSFSRARLLQEASPPVPFSPLPASCAFPKHGNTL